MLSQRMTKKMEWYFYRWVNQMSDRDLEFEAFFQKKLQEEQQTLKNPSYSTEELRRIYHQEYQFIKKMPGLELKMEPQDLTFDIADYYPPEKWEMPRDGKLLYNDEELLRVLKLITYNIGVKKGFRFYSPVIN